MSKFPKRLSFFKGFEGLGFKVLGFLGFWGMGQGKNGPTGMRLVSLLAESWLRCSQGPAKGLNRVWGVWG